MNVMEHYEQMNYCPNCEIYIIYSIIDPYCGIEIEHIVKYEKDAIEICEAHNKVRPSWDKWDYFEQKIENKKDILKEITSFNQTL